MHLQQAILHRSLLQAEVIPVSADLVHMVTSTCVYCPF